MSLLPLPLKERFKLAKPKSRRKEILLPGISHSKRNQIWYQRQLRNLIKAIQEQVNTRIVPALFKFEADYVADVDFVTIISEHIAAVGLQWKNITPTARPMAEQVVNQEATHNTRKLEAGIKGSTGLDLDRIIQSEGIETTLRAKVAENVALIQSIPDEYFKKLNTIVYENITMGESAGGIYKQIKKLGETTEARAKLIARDQTSKINGAINRTRQAKLGVTSYIWQTSQDERVRESHRRHNGKEFRWDKPPKDTGHPTEDIQCRCVARAVVKLEDL